MSTNIDIVGDIYKAGQAGDIESILRHLDPEFVCYEAASLPYAGEYRGREGMLRLFQAVNATWETFTPEVKELIDAGSTVIAMVQLRVTFRGSDRAEEMLLAEIWRLRDGKAVELRPFYWDTAQLLPKPERAA